MGADFSAYTIIGISIDKERLFEPSKIVRAYDHNYFETDGEYCPRTGKKLWKIVQDSIPEWDGDEELGEYKVHRSTNGYDYIIGVVAADDTYSNGGNSVDFTRLPDNLAELKQDLKNYLEPLGMWDETNFGLYSILYCSH